jgi:DNA (cytosine-5)-methyltransferase 1
MDPKPKLVTIKDASKMLSVTPLTLRNWDKAGKLKALRHPLNNYRVYKREDIENLIEKISNNTEPVVTRNKRSIRKLQVRHLDQN